MKNDNNLYSTCIECYKNKHASQNVKQCNNCKVLKSFDKFQQDISKKDGFHTQCKECRNQKAKEYRKNVEKEKVKCKFCNKMISNIHNLKLHQNTLQCLKYQGKKVERNSKKIENIEQAVRTTIDKPTGNFTWKYK